MYERAVVEFSMTMVVVLLLAGALFMVIVVGVRETMRKREWPVELTEYARKWMNLLAEGIWTEGIFASI